MTTPKSPAKGTLRLSAKPAASGEGSTAPRVAKSGARKVAAAAARGERLRPTTFEADGPGDGGRAADKPAGKRAGKFGGKFGDKPGAKFGAKFGDKGPGKPAGGFRGARGDAAVPGRPAREGRPEGGFRKPAAGGEGFARRSEATPRVPRTAERMTPPAAGDDVWAQAREKLAARARGEAPARAAPEANAANAAQGATGGDVPFARKPSRKPVPLPRNVHAEGGSPLYEADGVRVSKLLAEQGLCSRREADEYIARGWVFVNGERVSELGLRVARDAKVTLAPEARGQQAQRVTILLHKPVGFVSGQPEPGYEPAASLIGPRNQARAAGEPAFTPAMLRGLAPAGRLDIDSTGLLVLTQDGRIARLLIGEDSTVEKEYLVRVEGQLADNGLQQLRHGLSLDGKALRPAKVEWLNDDQLRFVLKEGRKRQIRRMCELVGLKVVGLKRVRIGGVRLGDLPLGEWRLLRDGEVF